MHFQSPRSNNNGFSSCANAVLKSSCAFSCTYVCSLRAATCRFMNIFWTSNGGICYVMLRNSIYIRHASCRPYRQYIMYFLPLTSLIAQFGCTETLHWHRTLQVFISLYAQNTQTSSTYMRCIMCENLAKPKARNPGMFTIVWFFSIIEKYFFPRHSCMCYSTFMLRTQAAACRATWLALFSTCSRLSTWKKAMEKTHEKRDRT